MEVDKSVHFNPYFDVVVAVAPQRYGKSFIIKKLIERVPAKDVIVLNSNLEKDYAAKYKCEYPVNYNAEYLNSLILKVRKENKKVFVLEDIDLYLNNSTLKDDFKNFFVNGRQQGIGFITTSKRIVGIPSVIMDNANKFFIGQVVVPRHASIASAYTGVDWKCFISLKKPFFWYYDTQTGQRFKMKY